MYKSLQKKDSSWDPPSIQKKGKGKPGTFDILTFKQNNSSEQQDAPKAPRVSSGMMENVMRSMAREQQENEAALLQRQEKAGFSPIKLPQAQENRTQADQIFSPSSNQDQLVALLPLAIPLAIITAEGVKWITVTVVVTTAGALTIKWWNDYGEEVVRELGDAKDWTVEKIKEFVQNVFASQHGRGNQADTGIVQEARALMAADARFDTMCKALAELMRLAKLARDTAKQKRIKKTEKTYDCREHREE